MGTIDVLSTTKSSRRAQHMDFLHACITPLSSSSTMAVSAWWKREARISKRTHGQPMAMCTSYTTKVKLNAGATERTRGEIVVCLMSKVPRQYLLTLSKNTTGTTF